jgi:hypothetical protein
MNEVVAVSSNAQTLIVTRDGTLWGCGSLNSQFGAAALETRATPIKLASDVISAFAGDSCSFFIKSDGSLWATGDNSFGQLGLTSTFVSNPTRVTGLEIRAVPTISWATPSTISAGTPLNSAQLNATASISGSFSYFPSAGTVLSAGTYTLNATFYPTDSFNYVPTSRQVSLIVSPAVSIPSGRLANIAARGYCSTDSRVMIGGFVIGGTTTKRVLVRATGPSLASRGINAADVLADPMIEVHHGDPIIATNDNWGDNSNVTELNTVTAQIGAGALDASDTKSSALLLDLQPGAYTFVARGKNDASGIVLLEVFDADSAPGGAKLVNIATRAYSKTGDGVTIGGFVIAGNAPKPVLLRAVGPTLIKFGISQADVLADPTIELHDASHGNAIIGTNDNWGDNANASTISTVGARIGASSIDTSDTKSSALLLTLNPGAYTFIASGKSNTSGIVIVEVYDAD